MILAYGPTETAFTSLGLGAMNPSSCIAKEEINGLFELEIVHPRDNLGKYLRLVVGNIVTAPTHRGTQPFRLYRVETDAMGQVSAWGRHIFFDLLDNFLQSVSPTSVNASTAGNAILSGCQFASGFTFASAIATTASAVYQGINPVQAIVGDIPQSLVNRWGGEVERDVWAIRLLARLGADNGAKIAYTKNLSGLVVTSDFTDVCTRLVPIARNADGSFLYLPEVYGDSSHVGDYPHPHIQVLDCKDIVVGSATYPTAATAYTAMRTAVTNAFASGIDLPLLSMAVTFVDLNKTEEYKTILGLGLVLGDTVTLVHVPLGISKALRIVRCEFDCMHNRYSVLTTGETKPGLQTTIIEHGQALTQMQADIINAGRMTTGFLSADRIAAGIISANKITAGKLQSVDTKTYFDLDNSEFKETSTVGGHAVTVTISPTKPYELAIDGYPWIYVSSAGVLVTSIYDVNEDGIVDSADVLMTKLYILGLGPYNPRMDVNHDGMVSASDLLLIKRAAIGNAALDVVGGGFGQLFGSGTGGVTLVGYGNVRYRKQDTYYDFTGEALITSHTGGSGTDFLTGLSIAAIKAACGITDSLLFNGESYVTLRIVKSTGALYSQADAQYGYGFTLSADTVTGAFLIPGRFYTTGGAIGEWASNNTIYAANNVWQFQFRMYVTYP